MKVYVVTSGSYSDYHIVTVCLDKEQAEEIARRVSETDYDEGHVEEYETATVIKDDRKLFIVSYYIFNGHYDIYHCDGVDEIICPGDADIRDLTQHRSERYANYSMYIRAKDEGHAKKIFEDKLAEWKAQKEGLV